MRKLNRKGTILFDAMVAVYILAIVALIYAATIGASIISCNKANETTKAASIANRQMESIKNLGFGNLNYASLSFYGLIDTNTTSSPYTFTYVGTSQERLSNILHEGVGSVTIIDTSPTLKKIIVAVSWRSKIKNRSITTCSEIAKVN